MEGRSMIIREREINRTVSSSGGREYVGKMDEVHFDSLSDILKAPKKADTYLHSRSWLGVRTFTELEAYINDGWPELEKLMLDMLSQVQLPEQLTKPELTKRRKRRRADAGNELDIH